jgi:peptide deformylase
MGTPPTYSEDAFDSPSEGSLRWPEVPTRRILFYPDPVLLRPTGLVGEIDASIRSLVGDMIETMHAAPGIGLAANQVGVPLRIAVIDLSVGERPDELRVLINPRILEQRGRQSEEEGCLSLPGITSLVPRPAWVRVEALGLDGSRFELIGEQLMARAISHELDHLDGKLFLHRLSALKRGRLKSSIDKAIDAGEWDQG